MSNKALILALVIALISISYAGSQEELPLEIEWDGEIYAQTYGVITEEELSCMNVRRARNVWEIVVPQDKEGEIYVYNGRNYVVYLRTDVIEVDYGEPLMEISESSIESETYGTKLISCIEIQSAVNAAYRVLDYWGSADLLRGWFCTELGVKNALSGPVTHWYNIGHGSANMLAFHDADMYSYEFKGLPGLRGCRIVLNSCYTYNGDLKKVITEEGPDFFIAGRTGLPIGPSEEVSADFWYYYSVNGMNEIEALNAAVSENPGASSWFGLWT